jgi:hypothetical protein
MAANAQDVGELLEEAAVFARADDLTAALSRAKNALRLAIDMHSAAAARLAIQHFEERLRVWNSEIDARMPR